MKNLNDIITVFYEKRTRYDEVFKIPSTKIKHDDVAEWENSAAGIDTNKQNCN